MDKKRNRKIEESLKQQATPAKTKSVGANRERLEAAARAASNRLTGGNRNTAAGMARPVQRQSPIAPAVNTGYTFRPVGSMTQDDYAAAARAFMAANSNVPQNTRTVGTPENPALQGMYDMTQAYFNAGGPADVKTYGQLLQQYYENAPTSAEAHDRIMATGGYGAMTSDQIAAMTSSDVYYPTQAPGDPDRDVNAWEWMTDEGTRDASRLAYVNQLSDIQMATAAGTFDNVDYLFSNPDYVSDDYLAFLQENLPAMIASRDAEYDTVFAEHEAAWQRDYEIREMYAYGMDPDIALLASASGADGDEMSDEDYLELRAETPNMDALLEVCIQLDNLVNGTANNTSYLDTMDAETRMREEQRLVTQYYTMYGEVQNGLGQEEYQPPQKYPYEYVMELVDNEVESRTVMRGFIAPVVGDPNVYELSRYDPGIWYDNDSYMDYYNVNAEVSDANVFSLMTDVERAVYNYYYNQGNLEQARAYLDAMEPVLLTRDRIMDRVGWDFLASDNLVTGTLSWGAARGANLAAGLTYPIDAVMTLMGADNGLPNAMADYASTVGTAQERVLGELGGPQILGRTPWQWAYTGVTSTADMGLAIGVGAMTGVNPLFIMGAEAAGAELASTAGSDYSPVERVFRSLATGGAEILTEKLPLDILASDALAPGYIWRTMLSEAAEEGVSEIAGIGIDLIASYVAGHESEVEGEYKRLRMLGYEDAGSRVMSSLAQQVAAAGLGGAIGGGMMGGTSYAANTAVNYGSGHDVVEAGNRAKLIELGIAMGDTTNSFRLAYALADAAGEDGNGRISLARVGQLYNTMLSETAEQYHDDVHQLGVESVAEAIAQRYSDLGLENEMETRYTTEELAEAIVKTAETGTEPGGAIGRYIREHSVTAEIMREFREGGSPWAETMRTRQAAAGLQAQMRAAQIKATKIKAEGGTETETNTDTDADTEVTHEGIMTDEVIEAETTEEVRRLTRRMSTSELLSRSIVLGLEGGAEEQTELVRVERTGDGLSLVVNRGGEEVNVGLDDVAQVSGAGVARVLAYAQERKEVTAQEINDMIGLLETSGEGFKSSRLISLYESALNAGFFGAARDTLNYLLEGAGEATDAMRAVLEVGYRQGQMQQSQAEETRLRRRADKETTGKSKLVSFMGDVGADFNGIDTGVRRGVDELRSTMNEVQAAAVDVIGQVARAVGVQVVLYRTMAENGQKVDAPNGFYDAASNAIFVDINSGIAQGGQELVNYTVMHTFAHELTHYIEHNAADGYKTLRSMVQTVMAAKGGETSYAGLVMNKLRMSANLTTRAAAEAEVIADACELMLRNTTAIKTLAEQDVTLAAKVRNFVANFAAKIRRAFAGLVLNTKESALLTEMRDGVITYVDGLQAAWDNALIEAANRNRVRSEMTGQNQTDGTQQGKLSESEGINAESEAPMKLEAPSKDWRPELDEGWDSSKMPRLVTRDGEVHENAADMNAEQGSTERADVSTEAPIVLEAPSKGGYLERTAWPDRSKMPRLITRGGEVQENAVDMAAEKGSTETEEINAVKEAPRLPVMPRGDGVHERIAWIDSSKAPRLVTRGGEVQQATVDAEAENAAGLAEAYDSQITRAATGEGMSRTFEGWATETGQGAMPFDRDTTVSMAEEIARAATEALNTLQSPDQLGDDANADAMTQAEETARQRALDAAREMVNSVYEGNNEAIREKLTALAGNVAEGAVNAWMVIRAREAARAAAREKSGELDGGVNVDAGTGTASISYSQRTWWDSDYVRKRDETVRKLMKQLKVTKSEAESWIDNVTGIANYIATNKDRLDYVSSIFGSPFKSNPEYGGTIDMSTLCPKRHLATGTLDAIQTLLGDVELDRNDFLSIREKMKAKGYEVACGLCFVESSRANMSKYVADFVKSYNKKNNAQIAIPMLNTVDGIERTRTEMPEVYEAFEKYMNRLAQRKPKLFEKRTEYRDEILRAFAKDENVESKNRMGGLRIQSFSDFEIVHLIDMMQVIMDMSAVGLAGQAYTKQPDFAWALGRTGLKINLSLIAKGVDENGNLIFDPVEGMDPVVAKQLRDTYSENVGTIVVVFTDAELKAAMKNEMVDFIIPFHRSQWKKSDYKKLGLDAKTRDYTLHQNERHTWKNDKGKWHTTKVEENYYQMNYWDFGLSGKENAQAYLDMCYRDGRIPKFPFLLDKGADGRYKLKEDGSTDGYWKLLIDFKMYNNDGVGAKQMPVRPEFNMEEANRMLKSYEGGHENFPVAQDVVDEFVQEYNNRKGVKVESGKRVSLAVGNVQYSERRQTETAEFKRWFGESKVVDEDGNPLVVYHGTNGGVFWSFDWDKTQRADAGWYGRGHYFATGRGEAAMYGSRVLPVYLRIENPFVFDEEMHEYNGVNQRKLPSNNVTTAHALFMWNAARKLPDTFGNRVYKAYDDKTGEEVTIPWAEVMKKVEEANAQGAFKLLRFGNGYKWQYDYGGWNAATSWEEYATKEAAEKNFVNEAIELMYGRRFKGHVPVSPEAYYLGGSMKDADSFTAELKRKGYDGVMQAMNGDEIVVFDAEQIKSATDNVGTFDPSIPDIRYSERRRQPDLTVRDAMMAITDTTGMTEAERSLLNRYQWNVTKLDEVVEAIAEQTAIKNNADAPETERTKAKQELWRLWRQRKAIEKELIEAETDGGYAKLMTTAGEMLRLLTVKDTMPEVTEELNRRIREVAAQLEEVQGTLGEQAEADMWNTLQSLFDKKKLRSAARRLKELYGARISEDKLMHRIVLIQSTLMHGGENASRDYLQMVEELTRELRSKGKQDNSEMLEILREHVGTIALTEVQRQEINSKIGMKEFLRVVKPVVKIVPKGQNGVTLDMRLVDAVGREGDYNPLLPYFQGHENEDDSIMQLYDLISGAKKADPYAGQYGREMLQEEMVEVMSIANSAALLDAGIETVQSVMDALTQNANASDELTGKVYKLKEEMIRTGRAASEAAYNAEARHRDLDSVIDYLTRLETQDMLLKQQDADRLVEKQVKDKSNKRIQAIIDERDQRERNRVIRERIRRTVGWMEKRIRKETDRKNVPEELKPYIEEAIRIFVEHNDVLKVFKKAEINDIRRVFDALKDYDKPNDSPLNDIIKADIEDAFKALKINLQEYGAASKLKDKKKKTMYRNKALKNIDEIVERLWGQIRKYNEIFMDGKAVQLSSVAEQTAEAMKTRDDYSVADKAGAKLWESIVKSARNKNLTPVYFFRLLKGNNVMQTLQEDVIRAQSEYGKLYRKAKKRIEEIQAKHRYWEWKNADALEFTTTQGKQTKDGKHDVVLTVDEAMSIWATWKREEVTTPLFESTHLSNGGFKLASGKRKVKGRIIEDNTPHKLTKADIDIIDAYLTEEQKAYATEMVEYMSRDMAEIGNRASMQMYGIRKFKESFYFPMSVHRDQLAQSSNKGAKNPDANRIAGMASAHRRVEKAWKALSIGNFSEVAANHINDMLLYGTFAVPIENFNSVLNYNYVGNPLDTDTEGASSMTVRALFRQKYGTDLTQYLEQYLADLNGGTGVKESSKLASLHRRSAVMASMSVMLQQPLSIIRAWAVQNPKYYMQAIRGKAPEHGEWEQLLKYSGVAVIKDINGFDMSSGRTMASGLLGNPEDAYNLAQKAAALVGVNVKGERLAGAQRQWEDLLGLGAQKADQLAWVYMWRAAKAETAEKHKGMNTNSEEFLNLAARRFEEVVTLTQVYNSTLVRSQNMRSKSQFAQMVTAFMAEPTLTWNMLMDGVQETLDSKSAKPIAKAAGIFLISQIATAVVKSLWTAGRDDDEEKPWLEKYLAAVGGELGGIGSSLNIFNLLPYARDVMSLLEGCDVERADMSLIADLATEVNKINSGKYDDAPMVGVKNLVFALANLLGIPAKNLWRDVNTGITTVKDIVQPGRAVNTLSLANDAAENYLGWLPWVDTSNAAYYERIYNAMERGDADEVTALTEYMGIQGKDAKDVASGVKGVVKDRLLAGKITAEEAKEFLVKHGLVKEEKDAYKAVDEWLDKDANRDEAGDLPEDYEYTVFRGLYEALEGGNAQAIRAEMDKLTSNGWEADDVRDKIREYVNKEYREGRMPQEEAKRLLQAYGEYTTYEDENDWYWHFEGQDYSTENGTESTFSRYGALHTAIDGGKATEIKAAVKQLTDNGYTEEKVQSEVYSYLGEQYMAGKISWEQLMNLAKQYGGKGDNDENDWYWAKRKYEYGKANGGKTTGYGQFSDYLEAVRTAKNLRNVTKDYLDHGVEKGTLKKQLRGAFREEYRTLYRTNRTQFANLRANLVNALVVMGETRDKAMKYLDGWLED